jgi:hypothetical protein
MQLKLNQSPLKLTSVCDAEAGGVMGLVYSPGFIWLKIGTSG